MHVLEQPAAVRPLRVAAVPTFAGTHAAGLLVLGTAVAIGQQPRPEGGSSK